jgi:hypothetical protein
VTFSEVPIVLLLRFEPALQIRLSGCAFGSSCTVLRAWLTHRRAMSEARIEQLGERVPARCSRIARHLPHVLTLSEQLDVVAP